MTEIFKILIIYPIFLIFIFVPFPVFNKINNKLNLDLLTVNLIINCNILLFFSLSGIDANYFIIITIIYSLTPVATISFFTDSSRLYFGSAHHWAKVLVFIAILYAWKINWSNDSKVNLRFGLVLRAILVFFH